MADQQEDKQQSNVNIEFNAATTGMNMDNTVNQVQKGMLTYALNAAVENFDSNSVNYQNEPGNEWCLDFPTGFHLIGTHFINEQNKHIFFLTNPETGDSEIGYMLNNDCIYHTYISSPCLNFNINYPIHKAVHKKTSCNTEIYWTDGYNDRRYLDLDDPTTVYTTVFGSNVCDNETIPIVDCNKLKIQPNFEIPSLEIDKITTGGSLIAGTYQFAIQYCDSAGDGYTSYYSVTNPTPIADTHVTTLNFNYEVGKSIWINITNIDITGYFKYYNLAVIKTINDITSVELVGTYFIDKSENQITYTGQNQEQIRLTVADIFEKFPYYNIAQDLTSVRDILVWDNLTTIDKINFQKIANQIDLKWQTYKIPADENYSDELNATNLRGYLRDEVYAFEIVFLLRDGKQTDGFHIPGRAIGVNEIGKPDIPDWNPDFIGTPTYVDNNGIGWSPYWKIYNTASVIGPATGDPINNATPYEYGEFAYWESTEKYPCNELVWGNLSNQPIRHHKFPDVLVSPIFESATPTIVAGQYSVEMKTSESVFPIGVKIDIAQVFALIQQSDLTPEQKANVAAFKIVRGNRGTNKSIVAKGILRNVGNYQREGTEYYYPNYPYNDLNVDPFLLTLNNAYTANISQYSGSQTICRNFTLYSDDNGGVVDYINCYTGTHATIEVPKNGQINVCALDFPKPGVISGNVYITCNTYDRYMIDARGDYFNWFPPNTFDSTAPSFTLYWKDYNIMPLPAGPPPTGFASWTEYNLFYHNTPSLAPYWTLGINGMQTYWANGYWLSNFDINGAYLGPSYVDSISYPVNVSDNVAYTITKLQSFGYDLCIPTQLDGFANPDNKYRLVFNSPETSFGQPFLGRILKLENVMFGAGKAHFTQVRKNALYKLISKSAQETALSASFNIAAGDVTGAFTAYQAYLTIYINGITRRNYAWSFNSIANYDYSDIIDNDLGVKQRNIEIAQYLIPGVQSVGDNHNINNWNRESSVYIKTTDKDVKKEYKKYHICNTTTNPFARPLTFQITDPVNGNSVSVSVPYSTCSDFDSLTYPLVRGGLTTYTITVLAVSYMSSPVTALPFPNQTPSIQPGVSLISDNSRFILSDSARGADCDNPGRDISTNVISYYASLKNEFVNQWGQIYSYDTIDTGFQTNIGISTYIQNPYAQSEATVFGGDTFISRFAFKTKLPFFIDNRVGAQDDSDIFYDEIGNVAYPKYWHSARSILSDSNNMANIISIKAHNFDCPNSNTATYYDGKMYLFAYGIPNFYCESSVNVDLRQAFNNREGDFWPHVSTSIPDDWFQESFVTIAQDNTYYYNVTFSKQNKENYFSHLPIDWTPLLCNTYFPFRAIYSDVQTSYANDAVNNWLIYRPVSVFDFPQNYGKLSSLDGIQNKAVLARFENKSLLYNTLLTIDTSNPQAAYLGNSKFLSSAPPIDFAETDLGYVGSQNKMLLKIPQGQITIDAKRGQVFLISGIEGGITDLSAFGSGMNRFFTDHLAFEILRHFPNADTDNHFNGLGLHGVYDSKYDRVIISKLDYIPQLGKGVKYDETKKEFYIETSDLDCPPGNPVVIRTVVDLTDPEYFCNKSWTISFNMNTKSWISFHSYIPNWYIAENNFFYSGLNGGCDLEAIAVEEIPIGSCFSVYNSGDDIVEINYVNVYGEDVPLAIDPDDTAYVCGISVMVAPGIVTTNLGSCLNGCSAPTTTTTSSSTTTTTTTATPFDCTLVGSGTARNSETTTTTTTSTTSTTTSSTTTTTTTLCPTCNTYTIENETLSTKTITFIPCANLQQLTVSVDGIIHVCACEEPVAPEGVTVTLYGSGCTSCFCYVIENSEYSQYPSDVQWITCDGSIGATTLYQGKLMNICAQENSIRYTVPITIVGGSTGCITSEDCNPTTTTTTTLNPKCKCVTFDNQCLTPSPYEYYNCVDELITGVLAPSEVLTVCGWGESAECGGVIITEGPDCTNTPSCIS